MRAIGFLYLAYPDVCPVDPTLAATKMVVVLGDEGDTFEHSKGHYTFQVYTFRYVQEEFISKGRPLMGRSIMIVPTVASDWMSGFLDANADSLPALGELE